MSRTRENTSDLEICADCLFYLANGEVTDAEGNDITAEHAAKMAARWGTEFAITPGSLECARCSPEDGASCEPWFSWRRCDGCGSTLGGDREHATAWL